MVMVGCPPRDAAAQCRVVSDYRRSIAESGGQNKPVMQSLYVDHLEDPNAPSRPIHLSFQSGVNFLQTYLHEVQFLGMHHVALNLRFNQAAIPATLTRLSAELMPNFSA